MSVATGNFRHLQGNALRGLLHIVKALYGAEAAGAPGRSVFSKTALALFLISLRFRDMRPLRNALNGALRNFMTSNCLACTPPYATPQGLNGKFHGVFYPPATRTEGTFRWSSSHAAWFPKGPGRAPFRNQVQTTICAMVNTPYQGILSGL